MDKYFTGFALFCMLVIGVQAYQNYQLSKEITGEFSRMELCVE